MWRGDSPLTTGAYLSLRTYTSEVRFDDIRIERQTSTDYAGSQRVALRVAGPGLAGGGDGVWVYLHADHLGSASAASASTGREIPGSQTRYYPFGGTRPGSGRNLPTDRRFTGQRQDSYINLYHVGARWYDPSLGRWLQPDTIVPDVAPQTLNRYTYANNSPLVYIGSDGHIASVPLLIVGGMALLNAIDYGWTAHEAYQSLKVVNDPHASQAAKEEAQANLVLTVGAELAIRMSSCQYHYQPMIWLAMDCWDFLARGQSRGPHKSLLTTWPRNPFRRIIL